MIKEYNEAFSEQWDEFVFEKSVNGNFLQSRQFLSYHPDDRFLDASLMYFDAKGNLRAVIPAAKIIEGSGMMEFVSHPGSTYGGPVIDKKTCGIKRAQELLDELIEYLKNEGYSKAEFKLPPNFLWNYESASLFEYLFSYKKFKEEIELTTYIDFSFYKEKTVSNFSQGKRTNINNGIKQGLKSEVLSSKEQAQEFYVLLCETLKKHDAKPVHTFEELWNLYSEKLVGKTELLGVYNGEELVAAGWLFLFDSQKAVHTQYLAANPDYGKLSPMTFLYYSAIEYCRERDIRYLSWGISTEERGKVLNLGLTESKESFGSLFDVHRRYSINF